MTPIAITNLEKRFGHFHHHQVLRGLNLQVEQGAVYALIGSNGVGKTTAIKILMNILQATAGEASVLGVDSRKLGPAEFAQIGYVSENQKMPDWMTVDAFLAYCKPFYPEWDDQLAAGLVAQFRLPGGTKLKSLSRGMRMKASLASSLAYRPKLIVLDEPFSGLDPVARDEFIEGMLEWSPGSTVLISSHDLADIESFSSHVGFLQDGQLRFSEETGTLLKRFREVEVTLDGDAKLPERMPASWLRPQAASAVMRFVDSAFHEERTETEVRDLFAGVRQISAKPMPLRAIFVALTRTGL